MNKKPIFSLLGAIFGDLIGTNTDSYRISNSFEDIKFCPQNFLFPHLGDFSFLENVNICSNQRLLYENQ